MNSLPDRYKLLVDAIRRYKRGFGDYGDIKNEDQILAKALESLYGANALSKLVDDDIFEDLLTVTNEWVQLRYRYE